MRRLALIGPSGFGRPEGRVLKTRSYREEGKDEAKLRETIRHNLLTVMLLHPESVDEAAIAAQRANVEQRSEEHTSELQSLLRSSYAVFRCDTKIRGIQ